MYLRLAAVALLIAFGQDRVPAQSLSGAPNAAYLCNFAKVKAHLERRDYVIVRSGAGTKFREIGRLRSGRGVYICDESGDWFKVYYSGPDGPCGSAATNGLDVRKAKGCQSGWVEKKWIDVTSG